MDTEKHIKTLYKGLINGQTVDRNKIEDVLAKCSDAETQIAFLNRLYELLSSKEYERQFAFISRRPEIATYIKKELAFTRKKLRHKNSESEKKDIKKNDIFKKYWGIIDKGKKRDIAFKETKGWLLNDLKFTVQEIKEKFNVTLEKEAFLRNATNHRPHNL